MKNINYQSSEPLEIKQVILEALTLSTVRLAPPFSDFPDHSFIEGAREEAVAELASQIASLSTTEVTEIREGYKVEATLHLPSIRDFKVRSLEWEIDRLRDSLHEAVVELSSFRKASLWSRLRMALRGWIE